MRPARRCDRPRKLEDRELPGSLGTRPRCAGKPDAGARYRVYEADRDIDGSGADAGDLFQRERTVEGLGAITGSPKVPQAGGTVRVESHPCAVAEGIAPDRELMQPADNVAPHVGRNAVVVLERLTDFGGERSQRVGQRPLEIRAPLRERRFRISDACVLAGCGKSEIRPREGVFQKPECGDRSSELLPEGRGPSVCRPLGRQLVPVHSIGRNGFIPWLGLARTLRTGAGTSIPASFTRWIRTPVAARRDERTTGHVRRKGGRYFAARAEITGRPADIRVRWVLGLVRSAGCTGWSVLLRKTPPTTRTRRTCPGPPVVHDQSSSLELRGIGGNIGPRTRRVRS